jgi:hypothetical protein
MSEERKDFREKLRRILIACFLATFVSSMGFVWAIAKQKVDLPITMIYLVGLLAAAEGFAVPFLFDKKSIVVEQPEHSVLPKGAELLIFLLPPQYRESFAGDLEEDFHTRLVPRFGHRTAAWIYRWNVLCCWGPLLWQFVKRAAGALLFWRLIFRP